MTLRVPGLPRREISSVRSQRSNKRCGLSRVRRRPTSISDWSGSARSGPQTQPRSSGWPCESDPGLLQARCALGSVLADPAEAEADFRKALAINPNLVCALDGLAQVLLNEGRYDAALEYWRQAVRIQPDDVDLRLALATATYKSAKARQADGMPPVDGAGVADAIHLFERLAQKHPDIDGCTLYACQHLRQRTALSRSGG